MAWTLVFPLFCLCFLTVSIYASYVPFREINQKSCIDNQNIAFFCTSLSEITDYYFYNNGSYSSLNELYFGIDHNYNSHNFSYVYYQSDITDSSWTSMTTCLVFDPNKTPQSFDYRLFDDTISNNQIGSITLSNIGQIMQVNDKTEVIVAAMTNNAGIEYITTPKIQISSYIANAQCIEIGYLNLLTVNNSNDYYIKGTIWRSDSNIEYFETPVNSNKHANSSIIEWNTMYCLQGSPSNDTKYIAMSLKLIDYDNDIEYHITDTKHDKYWKINNWNTLTESQAYSVPFNNDSGVLHFTLWQSCSVIEAYVNSNINNNKKEDANLENMRRINGTISGATTIFLVSICALGFIAIITVTWKSQWKYARADPINFFAIIWIVLELCDFFSDIMYVIYLYYFTVYYGIYFNIFFMIGAIFIVTPYTLNILYLRFLVNLWSQKTAPQYSKNWLESYSYILLFLCLITGGVHPALELCNSLLWPRQLFAMHLPYTELIRVRTERFVTNVLFENFPFLILQVAFYFAVEIVVPQMNEGVNIVFWGTAASSILSILFSGTYYFSYKYQLQAQIAIYRFSFSFRTDEFDHYWVHSHWRLQKVISKAFQIGTPSLIILDNVVDVDHINKKRFITDDNAMSMYIEGRIIQDPSAVKSKLMLAQYDLSQDEQINSMEEIASNLLQLFRKEFDLNQVSDEVTMHKLRVKNLNGDKGYKIFQLSSQDGTLKNICCNPCNNNNNKENTIEEMDMVGMVEVGRQAVMSMSDEDRANGIYAIKKPTSDSETPRDTQSTPGYLGSRHNKTLPMVSVSAADDENDSIYDAESNPNLSYKTKSGKHKKAFSIVSVVTVDSDNEAMQELGHEYQE